MAKEKVYNLAKEFKVSSEALVQMLRSMGITVKSHMSTVDEDLREQIKQKFEQERAEIKKQYARKKQLLAKAKEDLLGPEEGHPPAAASAQPAALQETGPSQPAQKTEPPAEPSVKKESTREPREYHERHERREHPSQVQVAFVKHEEPVRVSREETPVPAADGEGGEEGRKRFKKKGQKGKAGKIEIDETELKANVKKTLAKIGAGTAKKKYKKDSADSASLETEEKKLLHVSEFVTAKELGNMMNVRPSEVIAKCLELGLFVTINQRLDFETIELVSDEFGYTAQLMSEYASDEETVEDEKETGDLKHRSPVVTVMGHVDHGKTSLLDYIRKTNVIAGEAGGITQHIAAYEVGTSHGNVTFLDTPGHEAFTAMRARGSQITDVVVLVVAADSGVMPQTKEAIDHARAANVPIVVAINKIDLPTANIDKVKAELAQYNILVTDYGGTVSCVEISAKTGKGVDKLLETLALETEILELKAPYECMARGVVVESELDKGKGPIATVLIQKGILHKGDPFITGIHSGKVRDMYNERGLSVENAGPSQPVIVLGLSGTPQAGDSFKVVTDEKEAREISARRRLAQKERELRKMSTVSLEHLYEAIKEGQMQSLSLIIKGDVDGSVEALAASLEKLSTPEIKVNVIHKSVGAIKETDIMLAAASAAVIVGFHVNPNSKIREMAKREGVDIRTYRIIYEAVDQIHDAMEGMLAPELKENILATAEVKEVFKVSKMGHIAGCVVTTGTVTKNAKARLIREDVEIADSKISSIKRFKDDVREVTQGNECGISLEKHSDYKPGDRIEIYEEIKIARKLTEKEYH